MGWQNRLQVLRIPMPVLWALCWAVSVSDCGRVVRVPVYTMVEFFGVYTPGTVHDGRSPARSSRRSTRSPPRSTALHVRTRSIGRAAAGNGKFGGGTWGETDKIPSS